MKLNEFPHCFVLSLRLSFAYFVSVMLVCYICNLELNKVELS